MGDGVKDIHVYAFSGCSNLNTIIIGKGVKRIDSYAFANCQNLKNVTCYAEKVPSTYYEAFKNSYVDYATLYVPESLIVAYKLDFVWREFGTILPLDEEAAITAPRNELPPSNLYSLDGKRIRSTSSNSLKIVKQGNKIFKAIER